MAISVIAALTATNYPPTAVEVFRQQFTQLVQSLQSGDLVGAQRAYASLGQAHNNTNDQYSALLSQIGEDLQSGDLLRAQQALAPLQQQAGPRSPRIRRHYQMSNEAAAGSTGASRVSTNTASSSGKIVNVAV